MGIESDQLVFDYLSRVGDLAQQRQLPSGERMRLVAELREKIDRQRSGGADVKRILGALGAPDEVVEATASRRSGSAPVPSEGPAPRGAGKMPSPRGAPSVGASPPHLAGVEELGSSGPDWWRIEPVGFGPGESVPGFVGGIEIPELLKAPPGAETQETQEAEKEEQADMAPAVKRKGVLRRTIGRRRTVAGSGVSLLVLAAAALLIGGAVLGSWIALALGWLLAYGGTRLSRVEGQWAALGIPGLIAGGAIVWLWGRVDGRWGEPVQRGHLAESLTESWPVVIRTAAVASALFLIWRARRRPRG